MTSCQTCGAIFPDHWPQPIACNHRQPGKDYRKARKPTQVAAPTSPKPNAWRWIYSWLSDSIRSGETWIAAEAEKKYRREFTPLIPESGCSCGSHWADLTARKENRIDWTTPASAFKSISRLHNIVSDRYAGNPQIPFQQAWDLWTGPRVAFLAVSYQPIGGTETFHRTLLPRLRNFRNIVGLAATAFHEGDGSLLKVPYSLGVDSARELAAGADIVVTWGLNNLASVLPADRPKVISVHHGDWSSGWSNDLQLQQIDLIDEIVCVNRDAAENLRERTDKPVHWIQNAIDGARIRPSGKQSELRKQHAIPDESKILLFGHRLSEEKQPLKAIEIANRLPGDWVTVIAGEGAQLAECRRAASDRVRIVGRCESLADWLAISERFISLSTFEGYGLSVAESLAAGVPVVATPAGIAIGRARTVDASAPPDEWAAAVLESQEKNKHRDLCDVKRFVSQWADILTAPARQTSVATLTNS